MKLGQAIRSSHSLVVALMLASPGAIFAQGHDDQHAAMSQSHKATPEENELVKTVREATERFKDVSAAEGEYYFLKFGCVSGGEFGAMGMHFLKDALVDAELDPAHPEILLYEPTKDGRLKLTGADFIVVKSVWDEKHPEGPPQLGGQLFHLFDEPNRFGLPAFYTLHVWAWKDNPNGTFTNWNPNVSCDGFNGKN